MCQVFTTTTTTTTTYQYHYHTTTNYQYHYHRSGLGIHYHYQIPLPITNIGWVQVHNWEFQTLNSGPAECAERLNKIKLKQISRTLPPGWCSNFIASQQN